jgi:hypothetical protein
VKTTRPGEWEATRRREKWCVIFKCEVMFVVWFERMVGRGRRVKRPGFTKP